MNRTVAAACRRVIPVLAALALLLWSPFGWPTPRLGNTEAGVAGASAGSVLFAVLARRWRPPPLGRAPVARATGLAAPSLALTAVCEETVWRYAGFGLLAPVVGIGGALAATAVLFALVHVPVLGRRALRSHLVTGATFGGLYVATGRLAAPILAHLVYNLLVVAASTGWRQPVDGVEVTA